jgi:hypothetical protein
MGRGPTEYVEQQDIDRLWVAIERSNAFLAKILLVLEAIQRDESPVPKSDSK